MLILMLFALAVLPVFSRASIPLDDKSYDGTIYANVTALEGGVAVLRCRLYQSANVSRAETFYREDDRPLPVNSYIMDGYLRIFNVKIEDAGTYLCHSAAFSKCESTQLTVKPAICQAEGESKFTTTTQEPIKSTTAAPITTTTSYTTTSEIYVTGVTPLEQKIFDCLEEKGWRNWMIQKWYNRVLNSETRTGRATRYDQDMVLGCVDTDDYIYYGVIPDGYMTTATALPSDTFSDVTSQEKTILTCLRESGMSDQLIRAWYNRVLNYETNFGRVSRHDQDLAIKCIQPVDYLYYGVNPDGYTTLKAATPRENKIFDCLKSKSWSDLMIQKWYNRVLNSETRTGRATRYDQDMALGCVVTDDYLYYGVTPDGYSPTTSSPFGTDDASIHITENYVDSVPRLPSFK